MLGRLRQGNPRKEYLTQPGRGGKPSSKKWSVFSDIERSAGKGANSTVCTGERKQPAGQDVPRRWKVQGLLGWASAIDRIVSPQIHVFKPEPPSVTVFGDKAFVEVMKVKWSHKGRALTT